MKNLLTILICFSNFATYAQNELEWSPEYKLQLTDFQSSSTQIGDVNFNSFQTGAGLFFSFAMTNAEFMFTKNFNSKVSCTFNKGAASIVAPDSSIAFDILDFARFGFDLTELHARLFRQRLYEEKGAFSDVNFFRPIYDEVNKQLSERHSQAMKLTSMGNNKEKLKELHLEVTNELKLLEGFCKSCKPQRKKN